METLDQRRRRMMAGREDLDTERPSDPHREWEAALSQSSVGLNGSMDGPEPAVAGEGQLRPTSLCGSGSPDTMERGMMPVVPSPFILRECGLRLSCSGAVLQRWTGTRPWQHRPK